jgi:hypothetical protein
MANLLIKRLKLFLCKAVTEADFYRYCAFVMDPGKTAQALWLKTQLDAGT